MPSISSISVDEGDSDNEAHTYDDIDDLDYDLPAAPPIASGSTSGARLQNTPSAQEQALLGSFAGTTGSSTTPRMVSTADAARFKHYQIIYPIYIDAKRPHKSGERRVSKAKAVRFPKAQEIAEACGQFFGLSPLYEPEKTHPRDWANPGRVKVLFKDASGKPFNKTLPDSKCFGRQPELLQIKASFSLTMSAARIRSIKQNVRCGSDNALREWSQSRHYYHIPSAYTQSSRILRYTRRSS